MKNNNKFFTVLKERWQIYLLIGPFLILFVLMTVVLCCIKLFQL